MKFTGIVSKDMHPQLLQFFKKTSNLQSCMFELLNGKMETLNTLAHVLVLGLYETIPYYTAC